MVQSVEGTVRQIASHFDRGLMEEDREDLRAAGRVGAIVAAKRYDAARGSFNNYAKPWIQLHVVREVLTLWGRGRCCSAQTKAISKIFFRYGKTRWLLERDGQVASHEAVAERLGVSSALLADVMAAVSPSAYVEGVVEDPVFHAIESLCDSIDAGRAAEAVDRLDARERTVIRRRFFDGCTLAEIGLEIGLTQERVRQVESRALENLRRILSRSK